VLKSWLPREILREFVKQDCAGILRRRFSKRRSLFQLQSGEERRPVVLAAGEVSSSAVPAAVLGTAAGQLLNRPTRVIH
jgi:hypothetical protein